MSTKLYSFKYFANSIAIFDLVERHFPFKNHAADFNKRYLEYPEPSLLQAELDRILRQYSHNDGPGWFGYHHRIAGKSHKVSDLSIDFLFWRASWEKTIVLQFKVKNKKPTDLELIESLERKFFELLANGVNDAILETRIAKMLSENQKSLPNKNILGNQKQKTSLILAFKIFFEYEENEFFGLTPKILKGTPGWNKTVETHINSIKGKKSSTTGKRTIGRRPTLEEAQAALKMLDNKDAIKRAEDYITKLKKL